MAITIPIKGHAVPQSREEAIKRGLPTYFTNEECVNGHLSTRNVTKNRCRSCQSDYNQKYRNKDQLDPAIKRRLDILTEPKPYLEVWEE